MNDNYFKILLVCSAFEERPPISVKVREYFERFIHENLLQKKNIIIGGKWRINLGLILLEEGPRGPKTITLAKSPRTISNENTRLYEAVVPLKPIQQSKEPYLKTIQTIYEALKIFFTTTYKKITPGFMDELWQQVDIDYLLSLPYPAPLEDQQYVGDSPLPGGAMIVHRN